MPATLTPPFPNAPLVLVALEVRFPEVESAATRAGQIRELVRSALPLRETMNVHTIQIGPGGSPAITQQVFPRFITRDKTTAFTINPASVVIETTNYDGYTPFRDLIALCMTAAQSALAPDGMNRIGLRYIDEIRVPTVSTLPGDWSGWISDHLLAAVDATFLADTKLTPKVWQGHVQYSTGTDATLALRYGPAEGFAVQPEGPLRRLKSEAAGPYFLFDTDSYWEADNSVPEFDADAIIECCDALHAPTRAIFDVVTTKRLRDEVFAKESE